jgi:hypothetical protein
MEYYVIFNMQTQTLYDRLTCKIPLSMGATDKILRTKTHMLNDTKLINRH